MSRSLVLIGSGETSPTMVTPHQKMLADIGLKRIILDTPYGFQENADELTSRIKNYFSTSVGTELTPVRLRHTSDSPASIASAIDAISHADWVFAGPGSPTYALRVFRETGAGAALHQLLTHGTLLVSSAAALTVGSHTMPVYEMYKVGNDPHWVEGLDLLGTATGLKAAVIPHFNNAEGGTHDTRFCYIGESRLAHLEKELPEDTFILGIDEHTGVNFDLDARTATVFGRGAMTVRMDAMNWRVESGTTVTIEEIAVHAGTRLQSAPDVAPRVADFETVSHLLDAGEVNDAVEALLSLDQIERDIDTRAVVHSLVTRLGQIAASPRVDVQTIVAPFIDALLQARQAARAQGHWSEADAIRDRLIELKVSIKDTADGSQWQIASNEENQNGSQERQ